MIIILDIGANDGCSILKFQDILKNMNIYDYKIYSFEANPFFRDSLIEKGKNNKKVKIFYNLVGTKNGKEKLYLSQDGNDGSSIYADKQTNGVDRNVYVECDEIDIVEFILKLPNYDELWLKMDIEGGEYNIIPHMYKNNCLQKINKLFIEWHFNKIKSITTETHYKVYNMVKHLPIYNWDALSHNNKSYYYKYKYQKYIEDIKNKLQNK